MRRAISRTFLGVSLLLLISTAGLWVWSSFRTPSIGRFWCSEVREHAQSGTSEVGVVQLSAACARGHAQIGLASHPIRRDQSPPGAEWPPSGLSTMSFLPQTRTKWLWFLWEKNDRGATCVLLKGIEFGWRGSDSERTRYVFAQARLWVLMAVFAVPLAIAGWTIGVRSWRRRRGKCPYCGYLRIGLSTQIPCPECGSMEIGKGAAATMLIDACSPDRADVDPHAARDDESARPT